MRIRTLLGAALSAVALAVGVVAPAHATEFVNPKIGLQACIDRHDFTEFFRNNSSTDKYCFSALGPNRSVLTANFPLNHITWFHAGVNSGWFRFIDGADNIEKVYVFRKGEDTGCTDCYVLEVYLNQ